MFSPAIAKNVLAIGATSSGPTRLTTTNEIGGGLFTSSGSSDPADVDTVAAFSSRGPAQDGRIKPEVVAPGDMVRTYLLPVGYAKHEARLSLATQ